ncbi:hypothetical protein HK099_001257 [Clydaea vesicula]|uniref:Uncharacterized protein n=1 Tax=Clydaea vesicula TaxID=447962 RepID=A0AAD5TU46_9FUNG|nr:hypothetical protein HK099_001257 [Clydaea vesicula]
MDEKLFAFLLAFIASMGTFVGGVLVCIFSFFNGLNSNSNKLIGALQAGSGGVMLYMTFLDLVPEAIEKIGNKSTMTWFFVGVFLFGILENFIIPEEHNHDHEGPEKIEEEKSVNKFEEKLNSANNDESEKDPALKKRKKKIKESASVKTPSQNKVTDKRILSKVEKELKRTSLITFMAMFLHNVPEGLGVYLATLANARLGVELAVAIMLHNVPEGMAVALPLMAATRSYSYVLWMTLLNGLAEPIGVIIGGFLLKDIMSPVILSKCLACVAGIMACISLHELQPTAIQYSGKNLATVSLFSGMFICFLALETVHSFFHDGHSH